MTESEFKLPDNDVYRFLECVGLDRKKFAQGGALIGLNNRQLRDRSSGPVPLSKAEKLAMTAAWLGLPEFSGSMADLSPDQLAVVEAYATVLRKLLCDPSGSMPGAALPEAIGISEEIGD